MTIDEEKIQDLVAAAQNGDKNAFGHIYDAYATALYRFLFSKLQHKQTCEDLLQTVFLKAWNNLGSYRPQANAKFSTWLFQIANYTLIDHWRVKKETVELSKIDNLVDYSLAPKLYENYDYLYHAMKDLPLAYQTVLDLRFKQQMSVTETAQIMNKTIVGIRVMQHRAIRALRKKLEGVI